MKKAWQIKGANRTKRAKKEQRIKIASSKPVCLGILCSLETKLKASISIGSGTFQENYSKAPLPHPNTLMCKNCLTKNIAIYRSI